MKPFTLKQVVEAVNGRYYGDAAALDREIVAVTRTFYPDWDEEAYRRYMELFGLDENTKPIELSAYTFSLWPKS